MGPMGPMGPWIWVALVRLNASISSGCCSRTMFDHFPIALFALSLSIVSGASTSRDCLLGQRLHEDLHASAQAENSMERKFRKTLWLKH